jgi:iron complex transport system ATP-binding protein
MKSGAGTKKVFCVSGAGTGAVLYRSLIRNGLEVGAGVLHENDVDCHVARAVGMEVIASPAFEKVDDAAVAQCKAHIAAADWLIDTGFPVGEMNRGNLCLLEYGLGMGKSVLSLRSLEEVAALDLPGRDRVEVVEGERAVLERLLRNGLG